MISENRKLQSNLEYVTVGEGLVGRGLGRRGGGGGSQSSKGSVTSAGIYLRRQTTKLFQNIPTKCIPYALRTINLSISTFLFFHKRTFVLNYFLFCISLQLFLFTKKNGNGTIIITNILSEYLWKRALLRALRVRLPSSPSSAGPVFSN